MSNDDILSSLVMGIGRGRPKKELTRDVRVNVRVNVGEKAMLDLISKNTGLNQADVVRLAIKTLYNELK